MNAIDYETEYDNRARVREHADIFQRWARDAAAYRAAHADAELDLAYGESERQQLDLFWPSGRAGAPIVVFLHGGYWRAFDRMSSSHLAAGVNVRGLAFAAVGYDLCPAVTISDIIDQARKAVAFLWRRDSRRIVACGHSAGGHLAACLVATDWKKQTPDVPDDLVASGLSISGLFDLEPLRHTSLNRDLRIDAANVQAISPLYWEVPPGRVFDAWLGAAESGEYHRQSREIVETWRGKGAETRYEEVAGANHFTVLDPLIDPESAMCARLARLAGQIS